MQYTTNCIVDTQELDAKNINDSVECVYEFICSYNKKINKESKKIVIKKKDLNLLKNQINKYCTFSPEVLDFRKKINIDIMNFKISNTLEQNKIKKEINKELRKTKLELIFLFIFKFINSMLKTENDEYYEKEKIKSRRKITEHELHLNSIENGDLVVSIEKYKEFKKTITNKYCFV